MQHKLMHVYMHNLYMLHGLPLGPLHSLSACFLQLLGLLVVFLNLTMSRIICPMGSTRFLSSTTLNSGPRSGSGSAKYGVPQSTCESFIVLYLWFSYMQRSSFCISR